jgi:hypothetical protein
MTNALQVYNDGGFETMQRTAQAMVKSGYFSDAKDIAQAVVKVMAGAELGLPPFASMTGIHVIKGKPTLGANLMASLIKGSGKYNYRVVEHTDKVCRIVFYENGEKAGESVFTAADAQRAGVQNMGKYPKNMLFARAISNGARWHCPDVFSGAAVYTAEELGADVDEDGDVIHGSYETVVDTETGEIVEPDEIIEGETAVTEVRTADEIRGALALAAFDDATPASEAQLKYARSSLSSVYAGDNDRAKVFLKAVFNLDTSSDLTKPMASAIIDWVGATKDNGYTPEPTAVAEAARLYEAAMVADGQVALFGDD